MNVKYRKTAIALFFTALMLGSPLAATVGGSSIAPKVSDSSFELTDEVDMWERSAIPLRADTSDATTVIDTPNIRYELDKDSGVEQVESDIEQVGVYKPNTEIDFTFKFRTGATIENLDLTEDTTHVHVVRFDDDIESSDFDTDDVPNTLGELRGELTGENVNSNATFENITSTVVPSGYTGEDFTFSHNFGNSGIYAVMVTKHNASKSGIELTKNGNISRIDGEVLISGLETVAVQQDVDADPGAPGSAEPGEDLTFDVDGNLNGVSGNVSHAVAVYKKDTVTGDTTTITFPEDVNDETNLSNITLESDIGFVSGVSNVEDDVTVLGNTLETREDNGQFTFDSIVSKIADEANTSEPVVNGGETILNASTTGIVDTDSSASVTVETLSSWEEGTYQYVYIASGDDSTQFATATGTLSIEEQRNNNNRRRSSSSSDDDDDDDEEPTEETTEEDTQETPTVDQVREELEQSEPSRETNAEIVDSDPDTPGVSVTPEGSQTVRQITFEDESATGTVTVREYDEPPESLSESVTAALNQPQTDTAGSEGSDGAASEGSDGETQPTRQARVISVSDISPDSESANGPATIQKTIDRDRFDDPQNAVVFHERGESWEELETTVEDAGDGEVTLTARTDSFSLFAVAEVTETTETVSSDDTAATTDNETETTDDGQPETTDEGLPGFGVIVSLVSLLAAALLVARRNS